MLVLGFFHYQRHFMHVRCWALTKIAKPCGEQRSSIITCSQDHDSFFLDVGGPPLLRTPIKTRANLGRPSPTDQPGFDAEFQQLPDGTRWVEKQKNTDRSYGVNLINVF